MKSIPVKSRIIKSIYFSPENGQLCIRFKNGEERYFTGVPEAEAVSIGLSRSPGQYYIDHIRSKFRRVAA